MFVPLHIYVLESQDLSIKYSTNTDNFSNNLVLNASLHLQHQLASFVVSLELIESSQMKLEA